MAKLETVPIWWYEAISLIMIAMSLGVILGYPTHLSWWAFFVSLVIAAVLFIIGYMQPGRPMAIMLFKSYGYITLSQGLYFSIHKANLYEKIDRSNRGMRRLWRKLAPKWI
ncbi:hypothetical protein Egran_06184 [Elaphomyces granulatus]|uniref:Uncharacterized protein n=1 Tax=Elaphomyces granulatus TaxID=519963 RepID=A0A232LPV5_9EURO|nr:hypothetical protein Egran_06184 [Elaphomyces granulatus]